MYVTKSGKKYHREGCRYLKSVYKSYPIKEVEALGYGACSRYYTFTMSKKDFRKVDLITYSEKGNLLI